MAINYSAYKTPGQAYGANPNGLPSGWDWGQWQAAQPAGTLDPRTHSSSGEKADFTWNTNGPGWINPQTGQTFNNPRESSSGLGGGLPGTSANPIPYVNTSGGAGGQTFGPVTGLPATQPSPAPDPYVAQLPNTPPMVTPTNQPDLTLPGNTTPRGMVTPTIQGGITLPGSGGSTPPVFRQPVFSQPQGTPAGTGSGAGKFSGLVDALARQRSRWNSYQ